MARFAWTPERVQFLRDKLAVDFTGYEIAAELGCSINALRVKMNKLGLHVSEAARSRGTSAAGKRRWSDPARRRRYNEALYRAWQSPEAEARRARAAAYARSQWSDGTIKGYVRTPETRRRQSEAQKAAIRAKFAWLPDELRPFYKRLRGRLGNVEAKRLTLIEIDRRKQEAIAAEAARIAAMTPWERQLERARKFGIVERPRFAANDLTFSPVGCALA